MTSSTSASSDYVDFNVYRKEYEADEHWNLRKWFMVYHWDDFDEEEILCCAQLFINIEFFKCKYPTKIMEQIAKMSNEVPQIVQYRVNRDIRRQENISKRSPEPKPVEIRYKSLISNSVPQESHFEYPQVISQPFNCIFRPYQPFNTSFEFKPIPKIDDKDDWSNQEKVNWDIEKITVENEKQQVQKSMRTILKDVVILEGTDPNDLKYTLDKTTASMKKLGFRMKYEVEDSTYFYTISDQVIAKGTSDTKKKAKETADHELLKILRANCFTVRSKPQSIPGKSIVTKQGSKCQNGYPIEEDNLGYQLLKRLGWNGGPLGKNGILDPLHFDIKINKTGLGFERNESQTFNKKYFKDLLKNFKKNKVEYDLIFSQEFTAEERAKIHKIATSLKLKSKSYGRKKARHLIVSTPITPKALRDKLIEGDEYFTEKYELIPPPFVMVVKPRLL